MSVVTAAPASLGAFAPPPGVARCVIASGNDAEGERAAERLAPRCARARVAATVLIPQGEDFDDDLVSLGRAARARLPRHRNQEDAMSLVTFRRVAPNESRIYAADGEYVGDVYALDDPLRIGARYFVIHLDEDPRGPVRIHDRSRIREVAEQHIRSHPFYG